MLPPEQRSFTERALRRERWIVIAALTAMTALAWAYVLAGAGTGMSVWDMTAATLFPHRSAGASMAAVAAMSLGTWAPGYWVVMVLMWWIMMIAMMIPSAAPMILLYAVASRDAQAGGRLAAGGVPTAAFAGGYLLMWLAFAALATVLTWALDRTPVFNAMTMSSSSAVLSAAVLVSAGIYQFTPLKHLCLQRCRNPAEFLSRRWSPGPAGALRMGLEHGLFCVGCCWVLMALLFVGGIMNVLWIGLLSLFVIVEKLVPHGTRIGWIAGVVFGVWGAATLAF